MLETGDTITYHPKYHTGDVPEKLVDFKKSEIIERLVDTEAFMILSYFVKYDDEKRPLFMTEIRPVDTAFMYVQFEHNAEEVSRVRAHNDFDFDLLMASLEGKARSRVLYIIDILQKLCKEGK